MKYARIVENKVVEICMPIEGFTIDQCFHPNLIQQMVFCDDEVQVGWTYNDNVFAAPIEEVVVEEPTTPEVE